MGSIPTASTINGEVVNNHMENKNDIAVCACMGRVGNDPYCPCVMRQMGLTSTDGWTDERVEDFLNNT